MRNSFFLNLEDQTDLILEFNDEDRADPRTVWDTYKAYMRGMIICYTSQKKKEQVAKQLEIENKITQLEEIYYATN